MTFHNVYLIVHICKLVSLYWQKCADWIPLLMSFVQLSDGFGYHVFFSELMIILDSPCSSVHPSLCPSVSCWCLDDKSNCFHGIFHFLWYIYIYIYILCPLGQDLGWHWIWASYLITYVHNGQSCDHVAFLAFLMSIFQLEPFNLEY